jgi:hypothetical protein
VIVSVIKFVTGHSSHYKAINSMSDWHKWELEALKMNIDHPEARNRALHAKVIKVQRAGRETVRSERSRELASDFAGGGEQRKRLANTAGIVRPDFDLKQAFDRGTVEPEQPRDEQPRDEQPGCVGMLRSRMSSLVPRLRRQGRPSSSAKARPRDAPAADEPKPAPTDEPKPAPTDEPSPTAADEQAPLRNYTAEPDYQDVVFEYDTSNDEHPFDKYPNKNKHIPADESLPDVVWVDHREYGCFGPIVSQSTCGSCYAFAATSYMKWLHCNQTGVMYEFSPQYIVDCGPRFSDRLHGCNGRRTLPRS